MEKTTVYLPADIQLALREAARRIGRPQAELIRAAISAYLADQPRPLPSSIGIAADGTLDATEVDEWLEREWNRDHDRHVGDVQSSRSKKPAARPRKGSAAR
jgi:ribbon-helix-helix CopG family protein